MTQWGLDTLFNPAKRHMDDEKRRLQSTRSEVGDNSGGKRINLDTGKVVIRRSGDDGADTEDAAADATDAVDDDDAASDADTSATSGAKPRVKKPAKATSQPSAAQLRAAKRRGRTPR